MFDLYIIEQIWTFQYLVSKRNQWLVKICINIVFDVSIFQ